MAQIHILSKETIDKIAAGEVVERPASIVKELLENAVDAKASAVTVEIKEGGIAFIRVTDNGCGIEQNQVPIAFVRHATSKIHTAEDLSRIASLGFRGEALSSIAAVSRMELITKTPETLTGIRYVIEGGEELESEEVGAPNGTTILVRNLFFNTPVRKKFLKTPQTEGGYISDLMEHMALANPSISFKYVNNGQLRFHTTGNGSLQEIIYRIYGKDISRSLIPVDIHEQGIHMYGFLGKPEINRANRNFEIYFVNGRFIKSGIIGKAIEEGYRRYMMQHKFPFVVLHFAIQSEEVDVNVHPTKMEVRFTNQMRLYDFIETHVRESLHAAELIPEATLEESREEKEQKKQRQEQERKLLAGSIPEPFESVRSRQENVFPASQTENLKRVAEESAYRISGKVEEEPFFVDNRKKTDASFFPDSQREEITPQEEKSHAFPIIPGESVSNPVQMDLFEEKMLTKESRKEYRIMGQIFDTYWLIVFRDKLFIIDQHAAHEKVKYENMIEHLKNNQVYPQTLNPPIIVTLSGKEESVYREYETYFMKMGFEIEIFGGNEYAIRSVPSDLYGQSGGSLFTELLDELSEGPVNGAPDIILQKIASMACKAAVKGNMAFDTAGMEELIDELLALEDPYHCPHGRPTIISMSKYELEKNSKGSYRKTFMTEKKQPLVILTGPTAAGKTALSLQLAKAIGGEIISADSMQVYRHMNIGSAKILPEEMQGIPHHLIDILEPNEEFNVVTFQKAAKECIKEIGSRNHIPILTGGTGFYIQAVLYDIDFTENEENTAYRRELESLAEEKGNSFLHQMLEEVDAQSASVIHENNRKRMIRALEFYRMTGEKISEHNEAERKKEAAYNACYFVLTDERQLLYERIDRRVDHMIEDGLVKEVAFLKELGCTREMVSMQGLGYKEILGYLEGDISLEQAIYLIKRDTRHFAKRQLTWFRREKDVIWVPQNEFGYEESKILAFLLEKLEQKGICPNQRKQLEQMEHIEHRTHREE